MSRQNQVHQVADILFTGCDIVTLDEVNPYIRNGAAAVTGNEIIAVGESYPVTAGLPAVQRTVDCSGLTMLPGLVDGHNHLFQHLGKSLGDGLSLLPWLAKFMMPLAAEISREDAIHAARLGALHNVLCGTTTIVDNHYAPVDEETVIGVADALEQVGVRGVVARGIYGRMTEGGRRMDCDARLFRYTNAEELEITRNCIREKPAGSLVEVWPAPENVVYLHPDLMLACHDLATELDVSWHSHCSESRFEVEIFTSIYNTRPAAWLHGQGILDDRITLAHGIWLDEEEIALLGSAKASIVHNPVSNQYLASGIIKLQPLLDAGANVALGTDGAAVAGQDMFEAMKSAQLLQRMRELDPAATSSELALCLATRNGGRMLRKNLGVLAPGALADFILVDMTGLHHQPNNRPVCGLTLSTRGSDVRHVVVNGEIVVENGRSTRVDQDRIIADAAQAAGDLVDRAGLRGLARDWTEPGPG